MNVQELIDALNKIEDKTKIVIIYDYDNGQSYPCEGVCKTVDHPYGDFEEVPKYYDDIAVELKY